MKNSGKFKRKMIVCASILLSVAVLLYGVYTITSSIAKDKYWSSNHLQGFDVDMNKYYPYLGDISSALNDAEEIVRKCNQDAEPMTGDCATFLDSCNQIIIKYFNDVYAIDVSENLGKLQTMSATYPERVSEMVGGSYYGEIPVFSEKIFINSTLLDNFIANIVEGDVPSVMDNDIFSHKMLRTVYIHEVIHYLGFTNDPMLDSFGEALTECLNAKVMLHSGIKYESITGYNVIQALASQVVDADPELVRGVLTDADFSIGEHFNNVLGGDYANTYDNLILMIQNGGGDHFDEVKYWAQFMTCEYVKAVGNDVSATLKTADPSIVDAFEIKWLFRLYG